MKTLNKKNAGDALVKASLILANSEGLNLQQWSQGKVALDDLLGYDLLSQIGISPLSLDVAKEYSKDTKEQMLKHITKNVGMEDDLAALRTSLFSTDNQKELGAVYTPKWLADRITQTAWQHWNKLHRTGRRIESVADVSCGTGTFLSSARSHFGDGVKLYGSDIDETSLAFARILNKSLSLNANLEIKDPLLSIQNNSLFSSEDNNEKYDVLIGNPPYIRSQNLSDKYITSIRGAYPEIAIGNFDLSIIFLEHAIRSLSEGGVACYITSSKFMHSEYGKSICSRLSKDVRILNIIDFNDSQVFPDYTTYTSVLTFTKLPPAKKFTVTHFPNGIKGSEDFSKAKTFSLSTSVVEKFPWNLSTDQAQSIIEKINAENLPLVGDIFPNILQGLRTGKNDIFVLKNDTPIKFEKDFLRPFVGGEEIKRLSINKNKYSLIYPYQVSSVGKAFLVAEDILKSEAPVTYRYLNEFKQTLSDRDIDSRNNWYAYSRVQNLHLPQTKKILVKEMMPTAQFAVDNEGDVAIGSGYALVNKSLSDEDLQFWSAILCTPIMEFSLRQSGTQLHSGWFRLLKHHLESVRLPIFTEKQSDLVKKLSAKLIKQPNSESDWLKLDSIVAEAFQLSEPEHKFIRDYITTCQTRSMPTKSISDTKHKNNTSDNKKIESKYNPAEIIKYQKLHESKSELRRFVTFQINKKLPVHNWYPFTQGYSEPLVDFLIDYMGIAGKNNPLILDPFIGSGTTALTCKKRGFNTVGFDISPLMTWVSKTKISALDIENFRSIQNFLSKLNIEGKSLEEGEIFSDFLSKAYSPKIWAQIKLISNAVAKSKLSASEKDILMLGLTGILEDISQIRKHGSHYRYMLNPDSIGLQKLNIKIQNPDSDILPIYKNQVEKMLSEITQARNETSSKKTSHQISLGDAKNFKLEKNSIDFVITSPPYLNRNNYIAQQKAELSLLSLIKDQADYKRLVRSTFRSHTDSDLDIDELKTLPEVRTIIEAMELTDGNNSKIPQMIAGYFIDLEENLSNLFKVMKKGGKAAFVVGNSRWGGVVVPVDHLLLLIAEKLGFQAEKVIISRMKGNSPQQMKQFGKIPVRESIVIFKKP